MISTYVIVARDHTSERVIGPFGCPTKWKVRPIENPEEGR